MTIFTLSFRKPGRPHGTYPSNTSRSAVSFTTALRKQYYTNETGRTLAQGRFNTRQRLYFTTTFRYRTPLPTSTLHHTTELRDGTREGQMDGWMALGKDRCAQHLHSPGLHWQLYSINRSIVSIDVRQEMQRSRRTKRHSRSWWNRSLG